MLESLDATAVRRWCAAGLATLREHQREIDELNVYPVPDGDTGTNLVLTVLAAQEALDGEPDGEEPADPGELTRLGRVLRCMARGALFGARGNSGVILAQLLRGLADALAVTPQARGRVVAGALAEAAAGAYTVVAEPVEGTLLSVARGAAEAAAGADSDDLAAVVTAAADGAARALALTPSPLPALARAGVVDAGGRGLVLLLDALVRVVTGAAPATAPLAAMAGDPGLLAVSRETGSAGYGYEVQYLLDAPEAAMEQLRRALGALGDSLVVVHTGMVGAAGPTWNVHVHVNDVGAAIEAGVGAGRPHRIAVTRFADQLTGTAAGPAPPQAGQVNTPQAGPASPSRAGAEPAASPWAGTGSGVPERVAAGPGVVAVADGAGLAALLRAEGAVVLPARPSTGEVVDAVRATGADRVVVLPNDPDVFAVVDAAAARLREAGVTVGVVPTRSPVQALAALAVRDPRRRFEDDVIAMAEAAGGCRYATVAVAGRDAQTGAGPCRTGDVLGFLDGEVRVIGADPAAVAGHLLDALLGGGGELVTLLLGATAGAGLGDRLREHLARRWPGVEVQVHDGGQAHHPLVVGVE
ncbi:MAG TPA: DAK2 domain-containing protein [Rugosimonospora sp.]|nr:DAK2 domain-containing protein [Rugosimonospora sp.]